MLCMLLYLYGEWKLTVHQMLKTKEFFNRHYFILISMKMKQTVSENYLNMVVGYSANGATLLSF
ncbi:hypothetical protein T08_6965 [Trichinella sp. T8]|nr:hypothetical protein T08_6965 [Trichinella sp. T8]